VVEGAKAAGPTPPPTRDGYTLAGWFKEEIYTTEGNFAADTGTAAITLHAKWTEIPAGSFVITFDSTEGSEVADQTVTSGGKAVRPDPDPVRDGYTFGGWHSDAACVNAYDFNDPVTAAITLYAKWTAIVINYYQLGFNAHGGSPVPAAQSVEEGKKAAAPTPPPTRDGYTLDGWYKEETHATKWNFDTDTVTANITLHAKWNVVEPDQFVVTFDSAGGGEVTAQTVTSGAKAVRPPNPTREGYWDFDDWYTEAAHTTVYNFDTPVTAAITLHAKWTGTFVSVTGIALSGSEGPLPENTTTDETINLNGFVTVNPNNATNPNILWTVRGTTATGVTNADLADGIFQAPNGGTLDLTATIVDGTAVGTPFVRDDISIYIVKPVTDITGVSLNGTQGVAINLSGATVVPGDASNNVIVWSVTASDVEGIAVGSSAPFMPTGTGDITLVATIANGEGIGHDYTKDFTIRIHLPGVYSPEVGFGDETSLSVRDSKYVTINSGDPVKEVTGTSYYIELPGAAQYTGIAWYINGTKSAVQDARLVLDLSQKGLVQITVEAYKDGVFDTGTFRFDVK
jgi:uncharacterized repeat protein (TIGR02543 family)